MVMICPYININGVISLKELHSYWIFHKLHGRLVRLEVNGPVKFACD